MAVSMSDGGVLLLYTADLGSFDSDTWCFKHSRDKANGIKTYNVEFSFILFPSTYSVALLSSFKQSTKS